MHMCFAPQEKGSRQATVVPCMAPASVTTRRTRRAPQWSDFIQDSRFRHPMLWQTTSTWSKPVAATSSRTQPSISSTWSSLHPRTSRKEGVRRYSSGHPSSLARLTKLAQVASPAWEITK